MPYIRYRKTLVKVALIIPGMIKFVKIKLVANVIILKGLKKINTKVYIDGDGDGVMGQL